jgi:hypothetical protein
VHLPRYLHIDKNIECFYIHGCRYSLKGISTSFTISDAYFLPRTLLKLDLNALLVRLIYYFQAGLPDFLLCMIPKPEKVYEMNIKCTNWS